MKLKFCALPVLLIFMGGLPAALAQADENLPVVYQLTWIDSNQMVHLLNAFYPGRVRANGPLNAIAFSGTEKQHTLVEEFIKRYDVPPAGLEFQFYVLRGSAEGAGLRDGVPDFVRRVLEEVGALTRFKSFELIDSPVLRAREGRQAQISGQGPLAYEIALKPKQVVHDGDAASIRVDDCFVEYRILAGYTVGDAVVEPGKAEAEHQQEGVTYAVKPLYKTAGMQTSFIIGDGETVVLGASRMPAEQTGDWAIITVVTARILE